MRVFFVRPQHYTRVSGYETLINVVGSKCERALLLASADVIELSACAVAYALVRV